MFYYLETTTAYVYGDCCLTAECDIQEAVNVYVLMCIFETPCGSAPQPSNQTSEYKSCLQLVVHVFQASGGAFSTNGNASACYQPSSCRSKIVLEPLYSAFLDR